MTAMYWTNSEIQVLLEVTLQYKEEKSRQNIDWRSHTSTYHDIWKTFLQVYPVKKAEEGVMNFPHDVEKINKAKVIFRLMDMRRKFHKQMDTRNIYSGFWDICEKIWCEKEPCDIPAVEQAPVEEGEEVEEEEEEEEGDSEDTYSAWESESTGEDWSSTESEDETETYKPPCKRRLFEDDAYYDQLDRYSRESEERFRLHEERMEKKQEQLLDLLLLYVKKSARYNEHQRDGLLEDMVLLKTWSSGTGPSEDMVPMHSELGQQEKLEHRL